MTDQFFAQAPCTFKSYDVTQEQLRELEACLNGEISAKDAAMRLTTHPSTSSTPLQMQQRLGGLWTLLNDTAVAIPSAQSKVISILETIRILPKEEEPKGEGEEFTCLDDGYFWRELTNWANDWADNYNHYEAQFKIEEHSEEEHAVRKQAWVNANAYTARLASTGDESSSSYGAALDRASYTIVNALEIDSYSKEPGDFEAAAQLFIYSAPELYRRSRDKYTLEGNYGLWGTESCTPTVNGLWHGCRGGSLKRWNFWTERWAALASEQNFSALGRTAAQQALESMKKTEIQLD
ncbi:hypothetical protein B0J13DRAFT_680892 [Dactylonectria estremocensis]|uniref:Uncharacterized protein n=1 Tax=Dactylonectria estremocensis TaxID=1079267 RepID=A0A9P9DH27_9HYPO|nr:hypothetical protein B0J13DRAFT_680892 [Dactylonectria estremocensis]